MQNGIGSWLRKHAYFDSNRLALIYQNRRLTYTELNKRVNQLSHALVSLGVRKGDRVDALLFNSNEMVETMFACAKIGAIFTPINFRLSIEEVVYIINDSSANHFVYDERMKELVDGLRERKTSLITYIHVGNKPQHDDLLYEEWIADFPTAEPEYEVQLDDIHLMMYTSGTTGKPKGATLSHGNTLWNAINAVNFLPYYHTDVTLTAAPLFHIGGMSVVTTVMFYQGGTVVLEDVFHPEKILQQIQNEKVTNMFLVPAMWQALTSIENFNNYDLSSVRFFISGGAPCPITIIEFFQNKGIKFFEGFGLTETAPFVCLLDSDNAIRKNGSVGKAPIHTEVKVVDPYDNDLPSGEVGELIVRGPNIMHGYWNNPEATREAIKDGWFYTGDLARIDEEDFVYIVDRKKDLIITGGENVYPIEIEQLLFRHPNIREAAIIGYPDEKWGESIKAVVALKDPETELELDELKDYLEGKIAGFKMPKQLQIVDELPRNATGKILKMVLRDQVRQNEIKGRK